MRIKRQEKNITPVENRWLTQNKEFRKLVERMYKGFPNTTVHEDEVKKVIITEELRTALVDHGFFIKELYSEEGREYCRYALGPSSLNLIIAWKSEELSKSILKMNVFLVVLTTLLVVEALPNAPITAPLKLCVVILCFLAVIPFLSRLKE